MAHKSNNKGGRGKTDAEAAKDMMFGQAMERDMERYSRESDEPRRIDEDWKNHERYDGNRNLEPGRDTEFGADYTVPSADASFVDKMYMPYLGAGSNAGRSAMSSNSDKTSEFSAEIEFGPRPHRGNSNMKNEPNKNGGKRR